MHPTRWTRVCLLAVLLSAITNTARGTLQIQWYYKNKNWFPYNGTQSAHIELEEQLTFVCGPAEDLAIASVFLVNKDGFNKCSATDAYHLNPTEFTTAVGSTRNLFTCLGSGNKLGSPTSTSFSFKGDNFGGTFYLIDVTNLTEYNDAALAGEESGGRCVYYGMKLKIEIAAAPTASIASTPTTATLAVSKATVGEKIVTDANPKVATAQGPEPTTTRKVEGPQEGEQKSRAACVICLDILLCLVLLAASAGLL